VIVLVHTTSQPVPEHVWPAVQFVAVPQTPASSQVWIWEPEHRFAAGLQATHVPWRQSGVPPVHAPQDAPELPHDEDDSAARATHVPLVPPLQQPAQLLALQTQLPLPGSHAWPVLHATDVHKDAFVPG
jgi:hypothetical protein